MICSNSFMTEVPTMQSKSMEWFLYARDLRHERVKMSCGPLKDLNKCIYATNVYVEPSRTS